LLELFGAAALDPIMAMPGKIRNILLPGARSTQGGNNSAMALFNNFQKENDNPPFEELLPTDVEEDGEVFGILGSFAYYLATNPPKNKTTNNLLVAETVQLYFGKVKEQLKNKFPKAVDWKNESEWYSTLLKNLKDATERNKVSVAEEDSKQTFPIYRVSNTFNPDDAAESSDLRHIITNLIRSNHPNKFQQRLWIVLTYLGDGRGGEAKFLNYGDWMWDSHLEVIETIWREIKTLTSYTMVFGPDCELFHCDIYHALGCYWCLENGLFRTPRLVNGQSRITGYDKLLFPSIRVHSDNWLARKITEVLRMFLPESIEKWVTSRSLRKGSTTTMAIHPDLDHKFVLLRSGHSSRENDRFYIASTVAGSLPGFKVLSGWAHPHASVYSPRLDSLLMPSETVDKFISSLFVITIPEFKKRWKAL
jgi:hypothetical protein